MQAGASCRGATCRLPDAGGTNPTRGGRAALRLPASGPRAWARGGPPGAVDRAIRQGLHKPGRERSPSSRNDPRGVRHLDGAMPELPDIEVYAVALRSRVLGEPLRSVRLGTPFLLRTADPPLAAALGRRVEAVRRLGKRLVLSLEGDLFLALHLMIAGRLHWREPGGKGPGRTGKPLAALEFPRGTLVL